MKLKSLALLVSLFLAAAFGAISVSASETVPIYISGVGTYSGEMRIAPYIHASVTIKTNSSAMTNYEITKVSYKNERHPYWITSRNKVTINNKSSDSEGEFILRLVEESDYDYVKLTSLTVQIRDNTSRKVYSFPLELGSDGNSGIKFAKAEIEKTDNYPLMEGSEAEFSVVLTHVGNNFWNTLMSAANVEYEWFLDAYGVDGMYTDTVTIVPDNSKSYAELSCAAAYVCQTEHMDQTAEFRIVFEPITGQLPVLKNAIKMAMSAPFVGAVTGRNFQYETTIRNAADLKKIAGEALEIISTGTVPGKDYSIDIDFSGLSIYAEAFSAMLSGDGGSADGNFALYFESEGGRDVRNFYEDLLASLNDELGVNGMSAIVYVYLLEKDATIASCRWKINLGKTTTDSSQAATLTSSPNPVTGTNQSVTVSSVNVSSIVSYLNNSRVRTVNVKFTPESPTTVLNREVLTTLLKHSSKNPNKTVKAQFFDDKDLLISEMAATASSLTEALPLDIRVTRTARHVTKFEEIIGNLSNYQVFSFNHTGSLGGTFRIRARVSAPFYNTNKNKKTFYVYYVNYQKEQLELVTNNASMDSNCMLSFNLTNCSDYVVTTKEVSNAVYNPSRIFTAD